MNYRQVTVRKQIAWTLSVMRASFSLKIVGCIHALDGVLWCRTKEKLWLSSGSLNGMALSAEVRRRSAIFVLAHFIAIGGSLTLPEGKKASGRR
jgi:hypothetical protein